MLFLNVKAKTFLDGCCACAQMHGGQLGMIFLKGKEETFQDGNHTFMRWPFGSVFLCAKEKALQDGCCAYASKCSSHLGMISIPFFPRLTCAHTRPP